jgi:mRNA interferase MazF
VTYNRYDIVKVPFPFTDRQSTKTRPALVLSDGKMFNSPIAHSVMAMITTAKRSDWPLDTSIEDLTATGLPVPSIIRLKLFTLDNRLILGKLGLLASTDQTLLEQHLRTLFCL